VATVRFLALDDRRASVGAGAAWGEGPQTEAEAEREPIRPGSAPASVTPQFGALVGELRAAVGDEHVYTHEHQLRTYESDGLLQYAVTPGAVVVPSSTEEVRAVVRACQRAAVPFVARGAGSGLSGGALPVEDGVLISLTRMRRILDVDLPNQRVVVEPGVTNLAVSQAVAPDHFYPPDPSSQIVCTIGGNVAENSGGAHCFKYGFTTNYVTGLELVLPDGALVRLGGKELDPAGPDLLGAFVGSEGTLGVATRIWLRVVPKPETVRTLVAFFGSPVQAGEVVSEIVSSGIVPGAIEMMDNLSIQAAEDYAPAIRSRPARRWWSSSTARRPSARHASSRSSRSASVPAPTRSAWPATRRSAR
jgi:glycolate oxidase